MTFFPEANSTLLGKLPKGDIDFLYYLPESLRNLLLHSEDDKISSILKDIDAFLMKELKNGNITQETWDFYNKMDKRLRLFLINRAKKLEK